MPSPAMPEGGRRHFADRAATPSNIRHRALRTSPLPHGSGLLIDDDDDSMTDMRARHAGKGRGKWWWH
jgi:hypothetical protein